MCCSVCLLKLFADSLECFGACVLLKSLLGHVVCLLVAVGLYLFAQFLVVHLVAVFALHVGAEFLHEFLLELALWLDCLVSHLESFEQFLFAHFLHLAFHHHDVLLGGTHHEVHVGFLQLLECRVDDKLAVHASHSDFRDRSLERDI